MADEDVPIGLFCRGSGTVVVCAQHHIRKVYESGCYGSSSTTGSLKPLFMRKKRRRFRDQDADASHAEPWKITVVEAFYLLSRGELRVQCASTGEVLPAAAAWAAFGETSAFTDARRFACMFAAYKRLREQGWVVKMGQTYGGHFVVYQGDPDFFHSQFCVLVRDEAREEPWKWLTVTRELRVANQTAKEVMLCQVDLQDDAAVPCARADVEFVILLRWALRHEQIGRERQPHKRLQKKLLAPASKGKRARRAPAAQFAQ